MIEKKELQELAKLGGLRPWQQEKHYIQAAILSILAEQPLIFKGGTYLWFFHGLPRFSEDLDFTEKEKPSDDLPEMVSKSLELFGIRNSLKKIDGSKTSLSFRISAKGPLNTAPADECRVYVEISRREELSKAAQPLKLDFPAYNLPTKRIQGMDLEEVAAEKVRAIMTREKARDVFDLQYLIEKKSAGFNEAIADRKLGFYGAKFSAKELMEKAWEKEPFFEKELSNLVFETLPPFRQAMATIQKWAQPSKKVK